MVKIAVVLATVVIISSIHLSDACSCLFADNREKKAYCESQFVGTIRVMSPVSPCGEYEICHSMTVVDQLRGTPIAAKFIKTNAGSNSGSCGVDITEGDIFYLATDPIDSNTIGIYSCDVYENWTDLSDSKLKEKIQEHKQISCDD